MYLVSYVVLDHEDIKESNIRAKYGVHFGGLTETNEAAEELARYCVNNPISRTYYASVEVGATILPWVCELQPADDASPALITTLYYAAEHFEAILRRMQEADEIIIHSRHAYRKHRHLCRD